MRVVVYQASGWYTGPNALEGVLLSGMAIQRAAVHKWSLSRYQQNATRGRRWMKTIRAVARYRIVLLLYDKR